jgi:hypothetical protein
MQCRDMGIALDQFGVPLSQLGAKLSDQQLFGLHSSHTVFGAIAARRCRIDGSRRWGGGLAGTAMGGPERLR